MEFGLRRHPPVGGTAPSRPHRRPNEPAAGAATSCRIPTDSTNHSYRRTAPGEAQELRTGFNCLAVRRWDQRADWAGGRPCRWRGRNAIKEIPDGARGDGGTVRRP